MLGRAGSAKSCQSGHSHGFSRERTGLRQANPERHSAKQPCESKAEERDPPAERRRP